MFRSKQKGGADVRVAGGALVHTPRLFTDAFLWLDRPGIAVGVDVDMLCVGDLVRTVAGTGEIAHSEDLASKRSGDIALRVRQNAVWGRGCAGIVGAAAQKEQKQNKK